MTYLCVSRPGKAAFDHLELKNLQLQNLALYPSHCTVAIQDGGVLDWANVDFVSIGAAGERTWQFKGSGYTDQKSVKIVFTITTIKIIGFCGSCNSGVVASSNADFVYDSVAS